MHVPLLDLKAQYQAIKEELQAALTEVLESQQFILGPKVEELENQIAAYSGCRYGVGVSSGTDALLISLMALNIGPGDEVVTTPYTFFATAGAIARVGARPVFVDIDPVTFNIDPDKLAQLLAQVRNQGEWRVKALLPVHLFGQCADMQPIMALAQDYGLKVIEDAAQAIGAEYPWPQSDGTVVVKRAGSMGDAGCFSFFPSKNLGGLGDGGMVVTNDPDLYEKLKILRVHGSQPKYYHKIIGGNFRLDALQAAALLVKLRYLDGWTASRQANARRYNELLEGQEVITPTAVYQHFGKKLPHYHIYNQYVVRLDRRDEVKAQLAKAGIGTEIYYPVPLNKQECFAYLGCKDEDFPEAHQAAGRTLALPIYPEVAAEALEKVAEVAIEAIGRC
ncbi:MAG: DegT/DnrJ/EryC1/StrS family aminotransferase [Deltaproteobacteria bacterium]|nr:DegT/DnrJ/EryC1/StrS family aminotransferase [Deltaproteobacteria bacterium]MBW1952960.1 DegT/DnrJ/EryC1/StrS family aminotransferase [Deltaproteobacteria bacterium]MBW1987486.1 DegT/DnrJ/EryC1/StrS family aminotransferase [Deltaproteobacteria bacterium]MBW2134530.1 DegT/DnrJ/EryC1/StrS family aminotransferase [Deltaproteobacteria bacterium]